jgi:hypothetical protein
MRSHCVSAPRMFKTATLMCVLWLGATMMLVTTAQAPLRATLLHWHLAASSDAVGTLAPLPQATKRTIASRSPRRMPGGHRLPPADA